MTVTDRAKILDRKIKQNEVQYDWDRKAAKISALFSGNLDKYEYLNGEDLNYKSSTVEQEKLIILHWVNVFIKDWRKKIKKEGHLKKLKNIEDQGQE